MFSIGFIIYLLIIAAGSIFSLLKLKSMAKIKPLSLLLIITFISELTSRILAYYFKNSNPVYHFLNPIQCVIWGVFFYNTLGTTIKKNAVFVVSIVLILYAFVDSIFLTGLYKFPDTFLSIQSIIFICFGILLFFEKLDTPTQENIFKDPIFIISLSVIWFYLISFLFFSFHQFTLSNKISIGTLRIINYSSNYSYYTLLLFAILLQSYFSTSLKHQHDN